MSESLISVIVSCDLNNGIGFQGKIPWEVKEDMKFFRDLTIGKGNNAVIMGKNTWLSLPNKPLKSRKNIVVSKTLVVSKILESDASVVQDLTSAIAFAKKMKVSQIFIIGGVEIYKEAIEKNFCNAVYVSRLNRVYKCDKYFLKLPYDYECIGTNSYTTENDLTVTNCLFSKKNQEEMQYLDLIRDILKNGTVRSNRTGVDTISLFGKSLSFSLKDNNFPLLTTKKVFTRGIIEELLWFISGDTDANNLKRKGVNIWEGNSSREFLDKSGLTDYPEGTCGPIYGFQWRHFGAEYVSSDTDYTDQGVDQVYSLIDTIKKDPNSRRLIISSWNPPQLDQMVLPPCHYCMQFYVNCGYLECQVNMRSCDVGLGLPFNIASYALLTIMIAHCTDLLPGKLIMILGDTHIYSNHVDKLKLQLERIPFQFPKLVIPSNCNKFRNIDDFGVDDFVISDYNCYESIKMDMN